MSNTQRQFIRIRIYVQVEFFRPSAAVKDHGGRPGVMIVHYADGKATGGGFALFDNEADFSLASRPSISEAYT